MRGRVKDIRKKSEVAKKRYLNILQRQVLRSRSAMYTKLRLDASHKSKQVSNSSDNGIHVEVDMITTHICNVSAIKKVLR
jgi:hypothetical protein